MSAEETDRDTTPAAPPKASAAPRAPTTGSDRPVGGDGPAVLAVRDLCPFLLAADGGWRGAEPTRDHRCTAVFPSAQLAAEKQRRLCLTPDHATCATFGAATAVGAAGTERARAGTRPMPRTTPVVLERGRFSITAFSLRSDRSIGQAALVILLVVAFTGILVARLSSGPGGSPAAIALPSASPGASTAAGTPSVSAGAATPSTSPTDAGPSPEITLVPTEVTPPPSTTPTTYTVKRGDTLSGIASVYGTTWQVLAELNDIKDPSALRTGTVLQLP